MHAQLILILLLVFETFVTGYPEDDVTERTEIDHSVIINDFRTFNLPDRTACGLEKETNRIVGGTIADIDEFPWTAALEFRSKIPPFETLAVGCGGTLINNRYVLTSTDCTTRKDFELVAVRLGEWNTTSDPDCPSPDNEPCADPVKNKKHRNNDVALILLDEDIKYSNYIRPICLPPLNLPEPEFGTRMTVTGWGTMEDDKLSDVKLKLEIPFLKTDDCTKQELAISPNQLCAGGEENKNSYQGDFGGPLMVRYADRINDQPQWYLEGVISYRQKGIVVYARINRYVSWIVNELFENP